MGVTVGDKGVQFAAAEGRFVYGQILTDVLRIEDIFFCVTELLPTPVIAEYLLVLARQVCSVHSVMRSYRADALRSGLNPPLLNYKIP